MTSITHEVIETAYSIAMNCNHLDDPDNTCGECTTKMWKAAEAAEARAAQLETENDEMQSYINEIRIALHTEKDELTIEAVRRVISERDNERRMVESLSRECNDLTQQLEQAQQALRSIEDQAGRAALVQDRSVSIIKQTCKIIADKARAAIAT